MLQSVALGIAFGLSLAIVAVARTPARVMRKRSIAAVVIRSHRDAFYWAGLAAALALGLALAIALVFQ